MFNVYFRAHNTVVLQKQGPNGNGLFCADSDRFRLSFFKTPRNRNKPKCIIVYSSEEDEYPIDLKWKKTVARVVSRETSIPNAIGMKVNTEKTQILCMNTVKRF